MKPTDIIHKSWRPIESLLHQEPLLSLQQHLREIAYNPEPQHIFRAFEMPVDNIKVVIIGQDPYPNPRHASGYAFHPKDENYVPQSLRIINNEVLNSDEEHVNNSGKINLSDWPRQGILLLNTALTVERGKAGSHLKYWKTFTERVIRFISSEKPCIWMLWGAGAKKMSPFISRPAIATWRYQNEFRNIPINPDANYIMTAPHPMVEVYKNAQFYGCNHFYMANEILRRKRMQPITW